ncbi:uncharacterized protein A4U43_C03F23960 [Asparagus officinalis]|uniref:Uncharacterized protein n=1 Tax=Asparagus officinalis TaxID=4686 RepID=A0A5P1FCI2_ASPOF|nr:uncharacterized protein A4U43_C03F23960 [Asparagus officinalis]
MASVILVNMSLSCRSHYWYNGCQNASMEPVFSERIPLFYEISSQDRVEAIRFGSINALRDLITEAEFLIPKTDQSRKP